MRGESGRAGREKSVLGAEFQSTEAKKERGQEECVLRVARVRFSVGIEVRNTRNISNFVNYKVALGTRGNSIRIQYRLWRRGTASGLGKIC